MGSGPLRRNRQGMVEGVGVGGQNPSRWLGRQRPRKLFLYFKTPSHEIFVCRPTASFRPALGKAKFLLHAFDDWSQSLPG